MQKALWGLMRIVIGICASLIAMIALAVAQPVRAADKLGVVLIHGKQGNPNQMGDIVGALTHAGYLVDRPEMCWSHRRIYDRTYLGCLSDIDAAVARLRKRGATAVVIAGHSLGGNAAIAYGARHPDIKGVIASAPAHAPEYLAKRPEIAPELKRAKELIAKEHGDERMRFNDSNTSFKGVVTIKVKATPRAYASFFGPESPAVMPANASHLKMPLLILSGTRDGSQKQAPFTFKRAPDHRLNRFVKLNASHMDTPEAGKSAMLTWLKELAAK
jgi:pimeloyl-ACP methyl ester carboxylesterase